MEIDHACEYEITYKPKGFKRGRPKQFFEDDAGFIACFYTLAKLTSTSERGYFETCTYVLRADGAYTTSFTYAGS
jgi:hypothetical protein